MEALERRNSMAADIEKQEEMRKLQCDITALE